MSPNQNQLPIDVSNTTALVCPKCKNNLFTQVVYLRKIPKLLVGGIQDQIWPIAVFACTKCYTAHPDTVPQELKIDESEEIKEIPSPSKGIILG